MLGGRVLFLIAICLAILSAVSTPAAAQDEQDWRFGVVEAYTARNAAHELGIGWTRVGFQWADVQAGGPDTWTPELSDEQIDEQLAAGREVVGLLIGIPEWARDENKLPAGLSLDHQDPGNLWAAYVREAAAQYAGRIDHWIIWNEPDIDADEIAHTWDGSVEDFYQLQKVAYLAAKEANPDAVIHLAAFTYWADVDAGREQYMARLLDRILADPQADRHHFYFDIATAHLYFQPDQIYELLGEFQEIMRTRGLSHPIWLVETNAPPFDDPDWPVADPALAVSSTEQAAYMPQALAAALAAGAERIAVYKLRDTDGDRAANPEPFGLLRLDGERRVAYTTLREAIRLMRGTIEATRVRWDEIGQFELRQEDRLTTVLFARLPTEQQVEVIALAPSALLVDMWGQSRVVQAVNGRYQLPLQQALCTQTIGDYCMIGGTPLYLIQSLDGGPPPEGPAPIFPTPLATATLIATSTATPLPSPTVTMQATMTEQPPTAASKVTAVPTAVGTAEALAAAAPVEATPESASATTPAAQEQANGQRTGPAPMLLIAALLVGLLLVLFYWVIVRSG